MKKVRFIYFFFCVSILTLLVIFMIYSNQFQNLLASNEKVMQTNLIIKQIQRIQFNLISVENVEKSFLLTKKDTSGTFKHLKTKSKEISGIIDTLTVLTSQSKVQQQNIIKLKDDISKRFLVLDETLYITLRKGQTPIDVYQAKEAKIMRDFNRLILNMENEEFESLAKLENQKKTLENLAPRYVELIISLTIVFIAVSFALMLMEMKRRKSYETQLELKVGELDNNNRELQQIAFVASHDLKEPLRKIRTFNNRLALEYGGENGAKHAHFEKIDHFATRMQELIDDLVNYTSLVKWEGTAENVDVQDCISRATVYLEKEIEQSNATITILNVPIIIGYPDQLWLLFANLIQNALKYKRCEVAPQIQINSKIVMRKRLLDTRKDSGKLNFYRISVSDNGLGFDNEFAQRIFVIFQRLHSQHSPLKGTGIGLSICKRIMINHSGEIEAVGSPGEGATFNLYFPVDKVS